MKLVATLVSVLLLSACAAPISQKEQHRDAISKISQVEIFYNEQKEIPVVDLLDANGTVGGIFGFAGVLAELAARGVRAANTGERVAHRTDEFTTETYKNFPGLNLNLEFANKLATELRTSGKVVKVTKYQPKGEEKLALNQPESLVTTPHYARLLLRITTGYGAQDVTSSFQSVIKLETVLEDENGQVLVAKDMEKRDFGESYFLYSKLLENNKPAVEALRQGLLPMANEAMLALMTF